MLQDIRVAWRFLLKRRTATAIAVLTLGVTVGLCTIAVGALDEAFWRTVPVADGAGLITVYNSRPAAPRFQVFSYPDYTAVRDRLHGDVDLAAFVRVESTLGGTRWPRRTQGELVSGNYFDVLHARAFAGRLLTPEDDRVPLGHPVIVLAHGFWTRDFGSDPGVIGRLIRLGQHDYTVAGIAPPGFHGPTYPSEYWVPLQMAQWIFSGDYLARADVPLFQSVGRLREGLTVEQVDSRVRGFETAASKSSWRLTALPGNYLRFWPAYREPVGRFLAVFAGITIAVLIVACANLAGLQIARAAERERELALRQALGASRLQLARRLIAESIILIALGGPAGALVAYWASSAIVRVPVPVPAPIAVTFDARLAVICLAIGLAAAFAFTALSAVKSFRSNIQTILVSSSLSFAPRAGAHRALVVAQVAVGCVMLTIGGLLLRSALNVEHVDVGLGTTEGLIGRVTLDDQGYAPAAGIAIYDRLRQTLERYPQIGGVALAWHPPVGRGRTTSTFTIGAVPEQQQARYNVVSPSYFKTLGIPLLGGREFDDRDRVGTEPVAIVNETLAASFSGDPLGQTIRLVNESQPRRVVGVAREIKYNGITEPPQPFLYLPMGQVFRGDATVHLRTVAPDAADLLRAELRRIDPNIALSDVRTLQTQLDEARATPRAAAIVAVGAAAIAVFLALVGVYGVLTTSVEQRRRELAIRAALGATERTLARGVAVEGLMLTLAGLAFGMLASAGAGRFVTDLLFDVQPLDRLVLGLVPVIGLMVSLIAWIAPVRRAAGIDPVTVLKNS